MNNFSLKKSALALAVASSFSLISLPADAAGLGRLTVFSGLGQPLRAEIEISASIDELAGMSARLAPDEVFRKSGVEYSYVLPDLRFKIVTKNKKTVLEVTSSRTINEPFLDFLVELNWPSGRLVREYTFLLDPPEIKKHIAKGVKKPVTNVFAGKDNLPPIGSTPTQTTASSAIQRPGAATTKKSSGGGYVQQPRLSGDEYIVQKGDTLGEIARRAQTVSVTTEQMLIALYQANPNAFLQNNINLLKSGVRIRIPTIEEVANISERDARRIYSQHVSQWNEYRQRLAGEVPSTQSASASQTASGKITAAAPQEQLPASGVNRDQVRVSTTETGSVAAEINQLAQENALKEAETRLQMLERNMAEMQKLLELKNQQIAELQLRAEGDAAKPAKPIEPAPSPIPAEPEPAIAPEQPAAAEQPIADEPTPAPEPAPEPKPEPEPVAPPPIPQEPSFLEENMLYIGGGVLALLLLGGFAFYKKRKRDAEDEEEYDDDAYRSSMATVPIDDVHSQGDEPLSAMSAMSAMSTSDGEEVNSEVDPLAEAEVYIAYGRDNKAEEVLKNAMTADPTRVDLPLRLLDIYAKNKDTAKFEEVAKTVRDLTQAEGPDWEQVVGKGLEIDPSNPLYASGDPSLGSVAPVDDDAFAMASVPPSVPPEDLDDASSLMNAPTMVFSPAQDESLVMENAANSTIEFTSQAPQSTGNMVDFEMSNVGTEAAAPVVDDPQIREEITTKLDLAKAYEEMGDVDGAKELYQEITSAAAPADLKTRAQEAFDRLSAT